VKSTPKFTTAVLGAPASGPSALRAASNRVDDEATTAILSSAMGSLRVYFSWEATYCVSSRMVLQTHARETPQQCCVRSSICRDKPTLETSHFETVFSIIGRKYSFASKVAVA
jgi:hypothetical protein